MSEAIQAAAPEAADRLGALVASIFKLAFWLVFFVGVGLAVKYLQGTATVPDFLAFVSASLLLTAGAACYLAARAAQR